MLYPIKVDVSSKDRKARLVDSILIDPTCLPIQISPILSIDLKSDDFLNRTIDQNSKYFATTLMADMEVHSCSRLNKNGRVKLFEMYPEMEEMIDNQISSQLRIILERIRNRLPKMKKRKLASDDGDKKGGESKKTKDDVETCSNDGLVRVNIRLRVDKISIVDELIVDPEHLMSNPLFLAETIAKDFKLPRKVVNSIAISISEQICGLKVKEDVDGMMKFDESVKSKITPNKLPSELMKVSKEVSCAWWLDDKEQKMANTYFEERSK